MAKAVSLDKEVQLYRSLLEPPEEFSDGFGWSTVIGIFFCGLIMMPGGIYLGLMTGVSVGAATSWVTVILFMEVARRAMKPMSKQNLVVLLHAATIMMAGHLFFPGGPMGWLVYRAYIVGSEAARDAGLTFAFPEWFCPAPDSPAVTERNLLHRAWLIPIALTGFMSLIGLVKRYSLGYLFFRLTSDIENLPFPMAPVAAQGALALAEADNTTTAEETEEDEIGLIKGVKRKKKTTRWRVFSLGATIGVVFGMFQVGIPAITSLFLSKPFYLIPQPFVDTTTLTESVLPASPTGVVVDIGVIFLGFVLPFWSVIGTFCAIVISTLLNPILHYQGILTTWQPGMDTVNATYSNGIDFWMSFTIGSGLGIALVCIFSMLRDVRARFREFAKTRSEQSVRTDLWTPPRKGRGDYPLWIAAALYSVSALALIFVCYKLIPYSPGIVPFLLIFSFVYNPFISYVNARLMGISGQNVDIPFVKEGAFFLSGAKGIEIWLAPIPVENYGYMAQSFRTNELTGVRFWSLIKTDIVALPVLFFLSLIFWAFMWHSDAIPSNIFPAAQVNWELMAKNNVLLFSSTYVAPDEDPNEKSVMDSELMQRAIHPKVIVSGFIACVTVYGVLAILGFPIMLIYGMIRGLGALPHTMVLEIVGAMLGRYYFQKRYGPINFLRNAPALLAGYFTGVGLISMATIAIKLIKPAISGDPF
ncbi:MAG: peptide transporter [Candidatus Hydrogenedentes bacterium]|jgi:hypothetical protein|nr:peptide transporter [Candidatus Hydrogenedentota bacterium]